MEKLKFRQVHLDFHTGETFPDVGKDFNPVEFEKILKVGHIQSINLFAKCHHGCFYYYGSEFYIHPNLKCDLLTEMTEVCDRIGVEYNIYVSAGFDEHLAKLHPDWRYKSKNPTVRDENAAGYHLLCLNNDDYLSVLAAQVNEVVRRFKNAKGFFLDITDERICFCEHCLEKYRREGIDIDDEKALSEYATKAYKKYYTLINNTVKEIAPNAEVFHNMGCVPRSRRDLLDASTHYEVEALPNGWWGFDYFPVACSYVRQLGVDFAAHTARFHTTWGDCGGYKHKNAFLYETAWHNAFGSKTIIGDQLHPYGKFDMYTYESIGAAFSQIEKLESYSVNTTSMSDIAVFSEDYIARRFQQKGDIGAVKILLQLKQMFDVIDFEMDFSKYRIILLPDSIELDEKLYKKLKEFTANGGKILASAKSGLYGKDFGFDFGAEYVGEDKLFPTFCDSKLKLETINGVKTTMYECGCEVKLRSGGEVIADKYLPYNKRDAKNFSSHLYNVWTEEKQVGATVGKDGVYFSWKIFSEFAEHGSLWAKELVLEALNLLSADGFQIKADMPSEAVVTLFNQPDKNRYVLHLLYAQSIKRGNNTVIEDIVPLFNRNIEIKTCKKPKKCFNVLEQKELPFNYSGKILSLNIPEINCHTVIAIEY